MSPESEMTIKKDYQTVQDGPENKKTKSGKKQRKNSSQMSDKRSNSFSQSLVAPFKDGAMAQENSKRKPALKKTVIHNYMTKNEWIFNDKFPNPPILNEHNPEFVPLERSNSDVVMKFDPNRSFSRKMDNLCEGDNKYLIAGVGNKVQFKAPENIPSKLKHSQIIDQMAKEEREKCFEVGLPKIQEYENENEEYPILSNFEPYDDLMPVETQNIPQNQFPWMDLQKSNSAFAESNFFTKKNSHTFELISNAPTKSKIRPENRDDEFNMNDMALEIEEMENQMKHNPAMPIEEDPAYSALFGAESPVRKVHEEYHTPTQKNRDLSYLLDSIQIQKSIPHKKLSPQNQRVTTKKFALNSFEELEGMGFIPHLAKPSESYQEIYGNGVQNLHLKPNSSFVSDTNLNESSRFNRFDTDFEIIENLGSGNFGKVFKCRHKLLGLMYAVKITTKSIQKGNIQFAINEALALSSQNVAYENPYIVRFYYAWYESERLHLVMEYCQGSLSNLMKKERIIFTESLIRTILKDICSGLKFLHEHKIVHLDIKPDNILYSFTKKYKLADLGLSRLSYRSQGEDIIEGDSRYMAPELLKEVDESDEMPDLRKADIFSLGVTVYELMIGHELPKNGYEWHNLRAGNPSSKFISCNFSNSLKGLVLKMMHPDPEQRPSVNDILEKHLLSESEAESALLKKTISNLREKIQTIESQLKIKRKNSY